MKNILVPIDYSDTSKNALNYAYQLANYLGADIKLVNINHGLLEVDSPTPLGALKSIREVKEEELEAFAEAAYEGAAVIAPVQTQIEVKTGFAVDQIVNLSEADDVDIIVMGTTGSHNAFEKVFGSVSSAVSTRAKCPVLLIPPDVHFKPIDKILYASDPVSVDDDMIKNISYLARLFNSSVHFVHVKKAGNFDLNKEVFEELFEDVDAPNFSFETSTVEAASVIEGLNQYAEDNLSDLVVFVHAERDFWGNILHNSQSKKMALNTKLPLMVFHLDD